MVSLTNSKRIEYFRSNEALDISCAQMFAHFSRQERDFEVDLQDMLCADALATSRSTLGGFTMYHTRARTVFVPSTCNGTGVGFGLTPKRLIDARTEREKNFEVRRQISRVLLAASRTLVYRNRTEIDLPQAKSSRWGASNRVRRTLSPSFESISSL